MLGLGLVEVMGLVKGLVKVLAGLEKGLAMGLVKGLVEVLGLVKGLVEVLARLEKGLAKGLVGDPGACACTAATADSTTTGSGCWAVAVTLLARLRGNSSTNSNLANPDLEMVDVRPALLAIALVCMERRASLLVSIPVRVVTISRYRSLAGGTRFISLLL